MISNIFRARRLGLFCHVARFNRRLVMFQRPTSSLSAVLPDMDILPTLLGGPHWTT